MGFEDLDYESTVKRNHLDCNWIAFIFACVLGCVAVTPESGVEL